MYNTAEVVQGCWIKQLRNRRGFLLRRQICKITSKDEDFNKVCIIDWKWKLLTTIKYFDFFSHWSFVIVKRSLNLGQSQGVYCQNWEIAAIKIDNPINYSFECKTIDLKWATKINPFVLGLSLSQFQ